MMYNFPFYPHFPTKSYRSYPHNVSLNDIRNPNYNMNDFTPNNNLRKKFCHNYESKAESFSKKDSKVKVNYRAEINDNDKCLEILGIKLYFDDILLLCLIFFLYKEGVHDEYLFLALIMLLLS